MKIRINNTGKYASKGSYEATILKTNVTGSIEKRYINKRAKKEVENMGFAYVNQPKERIV